MNNFRILVVENQIIIADTIKNYLLEYGYQVVGNAISFHDAKEMYLDTQPDLVLLDIRLNGTKTGLDFANFMRTQSPQKPFIFLATMMDIECIDKAKATFPAGYLSKPVRKESLIATIEIAMHKQASNKQTKDLIEIVDKNKRHLVPIDDILYLKADHVYVQVNVKDRHPLLQRCPLKDLLDHLPTELFVQTHRSFALNVRHVNYCNGRFAYIQGKAFPLSRSRRKSVLSKLLLGRSQ